MLFSLNHPRLLASGFLPKLPPNEFTGCSRLSPSRLLKRRQFFR
jgi:hypothetical protein